MTASIVTFETMLATRGGTKSESQQLQDQMRAMKPSDMGIVGRDE